MRDCNCNRNQTLISLVQVDEFILMNDEQKTKLKWNFLLEKLRLGIQVKRSFFQFLENKMTFFYFFLR